MLIEIKRENNKYVLLNPSKKAGSHFFVEVDSDKIIFIRKSRKETEGKVYKAVKKMALKYPDNEFLKISLDLTPINYTFESELSNEMLLNDVLAEKYGI